MTPEEIKELQDKLLYTRKNVYQKLEAECVFYSLVILESVILRGENTCGGYRSEYQQIKYKNKLVDYRNA